MYAASPGAPGKPELHVFQKKDQHRGGGTCPPSFGYHHQIGTKQQLQAVQRESPVVSRVLMKGMAEWCYEMRVPARRQHPRNLANHLLGTANVLEKRITLHALKQVGAEWH